MTAISCPIPPARADAVVAMKHGAGGRAMRRLVGELLARDFVDDPVDGWGLAAMDDGAALRVGDQWLVVTTDSHVVHPIFFPGGDIGRLAIAGTVNDLAMMGATEPLGLTCAVVLEEGFPRERLERLHASMVATCREAGVTIVAGDTKVMGRGEVDGVVLNTTGVALTRTLVRDCGLRDGDRIVLTGAIGEHGIALMAHRHGLDLGEELRSDVAPLNAMIRDALAAAPDAVTAMKDPTRGGLAGALCEMAQKSGVEVLLHERAIPVGAAVRASSEMLGLDLLHVANEGKAVLGVRPGAADAVLAALRRHPAGRDAAIVGECRAFPGGRVVLDTGLGRRLVAESEGEPLPRIC